jgi:hypothetical protein
MLLATGLVAQQNMNAQEIPSKAIDMPTKFLKMHDKMPPEIKSTDERSGTVWIVYSLKTDNPTFDAPGSSVEKKKAQFLEKFYVAETSGKFAHIVKDKDFISAKWEFSETAIDYGWIHMSNLILSPNCLHTQKSEIALKCMVLNTVGSIQNQKTVSTMDHEVVNYFYDPGLTKKTEEHSQLFQILYVYNINRVGDKPVSVLVGTTPKVGKSDESSVENVIKGWVDYNRLTLWDTRIAFEPNFESNAAIERKQKGVKASVFTSSEKAVEFTKGIPVNPKFILWSNDSFENRRIGDWRRFPYLDSLQGLYKVGCMGDIKDSTGMNKILTLDEDAAIKRQHGLIQLSTRVINVVFVVDGTKSMGDYYQSSIVPAIQEIIQQLNKYPTQNVLRFGGVVYRDVLEGNRLIETKSLTEKNRVNEVITFFKNIDANDYVDVSKPEAVYYGLKTALRNVIINPDETNVIILIGDAGNHAEPSDKTFVDEKSLVSLMAERRIYCVVFQAHNEPELTYDDFQDQTKRLLLGMGKILYKAADTVRKAADYQYGDVYWAETPKGSNVWELKNSGRYASAIYAAKGETKNTALLKEQIVKAFTDADNFTNSIITGANQIIEEGKPLTQAIEDVKEENIKFKGGAGSSSYADAYGPGLIEYFRNLGIPQETISKLFQERWQFYSEGYIPKSVDVLKEPPFVKSLLYSAEEFAKMVTIINKLEEARNATERRERLEETWREVLSDYIGLPREQAGEMTVGEATNMLFGIPGLKSFIKDIKINDISDPSRLPEKELANYCIMIGSKRGKLLQILNAVEPREMFVTNNTKYYWIFEEYVP